MQVSIHKTLVQQRRPMKVTTAGHLLNLLFLEPRPPLLSLADGERRVRRGSPGAHFSGVLFGSVFSWSLLLVAFGWSSCSGGETLLIFFAGGTGAALASFSSGHHGWWYVWYHRIICLVFQDCGFKLVSILLDRSSHLRQRHGLTVGDHGKHTALKVSVGCHIVTVCGLGGHLFLNSRNELLVVTQALSFCDVYTPIPESDVHYCHCDHDEVKESGFAWNVNYVPRVVDVRDSQELQ